MCKKNNLLFLLMTTVNGILIASNYFEASLDGLPLSGQLILGGIMGLVIGVGLVFIFSTKINWIKPDNILEP